MTQLRFVHLALKFYLLTDKSFVLSLLALGFLQNMHKIVLSINGILVQKGNAVYLRLCNNNFNFQLNIFFLTCSLTA